MNRLFKIFAFIDNFKLRPKMFLITGLVLVGFAASSIVGLLIINKVKIGGVLYKKIQNHRDSLENIALLKSDLNRIRAEITALIGETDKDKINQVNDYLEELIVEVESKFEKIFRAMDTGQKKQAVKDVRAQWEEFMNTMTDEMMSAIKRGDAAAARKLASGIQKSRYYRFIDRLEELVYVVKIEIEVLESTTAASVKKMAAVSLAVTLFLFLVVLGLTYLISKSTSERIINLNDLTKILAEGDLSRVTDDGGAGFGKDEIGMLAVSVNRMALNLKSIMAHVKQITDNLSLIIGKMASSYGDLLAGADNQHGLVQKTAVLISDSDSSIATVVMGAQNLSGASENTSSAILEMSASIKEVAETSDVFSSSAADVSASVNEMVSSMNEIADSIEKLSTSFHQTTSSLTEINSTVAEVEQNAAESVKLAEHVTVMAENKGMTAVGASIKGMGEIKGIVKTMTDVIRRLGKRSQDIGKIVNVIDEIADQTNLLALNAAIIAAGAEGSSSQAFAVVAEEIKNLSARTAASTKEIEELVESVQKETSIGIQMTEQGAKSAENGVRLAAEVRDAFTAILNSSVSSTEKARYIQRATTEETTTIKQITEAVNVMNRQIEYISRATQEQKKGSAMIMDAVEKIKDMSNQVKTATKDQASGSKQISEAVEDVSAQAAQIVDATSKQRDISAKMVREIENVKDIAEQSTKIANEMNESIMLLGEGALALIEEIRKFKLED